VSAAVPARRAAVLGSPIGHSLSPVLHRAAYAELGLAWSYDVIECDEAGLAPLLTGLDESFVGLSLTMPLKRAVLPLLDEVTPLAAAVGAVNTVAFEGAGAQRRLRGDNTDVAGLVASIQQVRPAGVASVAILGAGGTAAATLAALPTLGVRRADVIVRSVARAADLVAAADRLGVQVDLVGWPGAAVLGKVDLVVSTVPAGAADALADSEDWSPGKGQLLFDVLYEPWPTPLASLAESTGADVVGGLELLVQQAARQVELWSGRRPPIEPMRAAGEAALAARRPAHLPSPD
jgi:shikimate dehydrogenase